MSALKILGTILVYLFAVGLLGIWSLGAYEMLSSRFAGVLPKPVFGALAVVLVLAVTATTIFALKWMTAHRSGKRVGAVLTGVILLPIFAVLCGAFYLIPAQYLTKGRDPAFTLLLIAALAASVFGIGYFGQTPLPLSWIAFGVGTVSL
ncbi:MAG: hypothetical protein U0984_05815, partial [Prosthecobacter sp.]|nr:hypothetical protein [Prosthecobacter sp.]